MSKERDELEHVEAALQRNERERTRLLSEKERLLLERRGATAAIQPKRTVFTPRTLAVRWGVSERHVRNLIRDGKLRHFRVGGKLLRIAADAVEEFEARHAV